MTGAQGVISGVSVSHADASVEQIEQAAARSQRTAVAELAGVPVVEGAFVLQTCNRVEAYVVTDTAATGRKVLDVFLGDADESVVRRLGHEDSLRHLIRVAAGLESLIVGEDQIIGQVRDAYEDARSVGALDRILDSAVTKAIHVGERARTETPINEGVISLGSAAVELAADDRDLDGGTALVVGAGEMATLAAKALDARTGIDRLLVVNRTVPHAEHVVDSVGVEGAALGMDALDTGVSEADVAVSATGSTAPVFDRETLAGTGGTVLVDLAQPRDATEAAADLPSVTYHDIDDLESVRTETRARRRAAAAEVEEYVDEAFEELLTQFKRKRADEVISAMYESAERLKAAELEQAFGELDLDEDEQAVVESMADSIVSGLLAPPTSSLRDAAENDDWSTINTALQLFDPDFEDGVPDSFVEGLSAEGVSADDIPPGAREQMPQAVLEQLDD